MSLLSERLKQLRGNLTQTEAAEKIGITAQTLGRYENDQRKPDSEVIVMLCKHYGVSADYLLGLSDVKTVDADIHAACKVTGLSEDAVQALVDNHKKYDEDCFDALSYVIESDIFYKLGESFFYLFYNSKRFHNALINSRIAEMIGTEIGISDAKLLEFEDEGGLDEICDVLRYRISRYTESISDMFDYREDLSKFSKEEFIEYLHIAPAEIDNLRKKYAEDVTEENADIILEQIKDHIKKILEAKEAESNEKNDNTEE
ncbi:MAG: helix-turn-helix transcriptional regulator [Oscillospiraceae bacterium]|nr:helix-turn-helix transcriptional regulator [Oscillospiraceae bacterium]